VSDYAGLLRRRHLDCAYSG